MKKLVILLAVLTALTLQVNATKHTVTISGTSYSPALLTVHIGDTVTISGSTFHPLVQVSKGTWTSNGATPLAGGWGSSTKNITLTVSTADTVYFVCSAHVTLGMKGRIVVAQFSGIDELPAASLTVSLYPNPVTSTGTVKLSSVGANPLSVNIFSINGQLEKDLTTSLMTINGEYSVQFDAGSMPAGNYFVLVTDGRSKMVKRFEVIR